MRRLVRGACVVRHRFHQYVHVVQHVVGDNHDPHDDDARYRRRSHHDTDDHCADNHDSYNHESDNHGGGRDIAGDDKPSASRHCRGGRLLG